MCATGWVQVWGVMNALKQSSIGRLESVYGLDCIVPGSGGAARACAWWSPARKEGLVELRLF